MKIAILLCNFFCLIATLYGEPLKVTWSDLAPHTPFEDPFAELEQDNLFDLALVARYRRLEKEGKAIGEAGHKEWAESQESLDEAGIDVDGLLSLREEIREKRVAAAFAINKDLVEKVISIDGFLLPLDIESGKTSEFLLVPWAGACIHTPPPPPNQIVFVTMSESVDVRTRFQAVTIVGQLISEQGHRNLFLVDGSSMINTAYRMKGESVTDYKTSENK